LANACAVAEPGVAEQIDATLLGVGAGSACFNALDAACPLNAIYSRTAVGATFSAARLTEVGADGAALALQAILIIATGRHSITACGPNFAAGDFHAEAFYACETVGAAVTLSTCILGEYACWRFRGKRNAKTGCEPLQHAPA